MVNTFAGPLILKFVQIKVRENTFKSKSNQLPDSKIRVKARGDNSQTGLRK